jgi:cation:H+ antiporter
METALQILGGLILLALGGEAVVRGAVAIARKLGVSELLIGLTLIGFGTSTPELLTSVNAAMAGSPGISVGNVVGSNISNILLIFAIVVLVKPVPVDPKAIRRDGALMILATAAFIAIATVMGTLSRPMGAAFVLALIAYIVFAFLSERKGGPEAELHVAEVAPHDPGAMPIWQGLGFALAGLAMLIFGADFLVKGAITLAQLAGMSETVIGLTIVAVGTSLPELVASLAAALKGRSDVAVGNIIGSNLYNILGILGITALVRPIDIPPDMIARDWIAMMGAGLVLLLFAWTGKLVNRMEGLILLILYAVYCVLLINPGIMALGT